MNNKTVKIMIDQSVLKKDSTETPRVISEEHSKQLAMWQLATAGPHQMMIYPRLIQELKNLLTPSMTLAEYGCGVGFVMQAVLDHQPSLPYKNFLGLEINRESRLEARKLIPLDKGGAIHCDLTNSHLPDRFFDLAISSTILCHFKPHPLRKALFHSMRMLEKGGEMLVCVPSLEWTTRENSDYVVLEELGDESFVAVKHGNSYQLRQCYYSRQVYQNFLEESGFTIKKSEDLLIPDDERIGARYIPYVGMPLFYFFVAERPVDYKKISQYQIIKEDIPKLHKLELC